MSAARTHPPRQRALTHDTPTALDTTALLHREGVDGSSPSEALRWLPSRGGTRRATRLHGCARSPRQQRAPRTLHRRFDAGRLSRTASKQPRPGNEQPRPALNTQPRMNEKLRSNTAARCREAPNTSPDTPRTQPRARTNDLQSVTVEGQRSRRRGSHSNRLTSRPSPERAPPRPPGRLSRTTKIKPHFRGIS